jgi:transposase
MDDEILPLNISPEDWARTPPAVQVAIMSLVDMVRALSAEVQAQRAEIKELRARLGQSSHNSSKPPSSDPPDAPPKPPRTPRGKPKGAQKGHPDQQRPLVPPEQVDQIVSVRPTQCPGCQHTLAPDLPDAAPVRRRQIWELPPIRAHITEYQQHTVCCPSCQCLVYRGLPSETPPGAFGPRLSAFVGLLHGAYHLSQRQTVQFLDEVCDIPLSLGSVATQCRRLCDALEPLDTEVAIRLQSEPQLWVDETSWHERCERSWLWVAAGERATSFRINRSRSGQTLMSLLGEQYRGVVHSDRASAYHALPDRQRQLCWAHLTRNLQGLVDYKHRDSWLASEMLAHTQQIWTAWQAVRSGLFDLIALQQALLPVRLALRELLAIGTSSRWTKLQRLCQDVLRHWEALWTFTRIENIEPTNNRAERGLRRAVIWRKHRFGSQSAGGSRFVERILNVVATARQQGQNVFALLVDTLQANWSRTPAPSLFCNP